MSNPSLSIGEVIAGPVLLDPGSKGSGPQTTKPRELSSGRASHIDQR